VGGLAQQQPPLGRIDAERTLYSLQNRQRLLEQAGIAQDPLSQTYADYFASRYEGVPDTSYQPAVPLLGYMEAQKYPAAPGEEGKKQFSSVLTKALAQKTTPDNRPEMYMRYGAPIFDFNVDGSYSRDEDKLTVNVGKSTSIEYALETLAHELEHRKDKGEGRGYWSLKNPRERVKSGHHMSWRDFEVDKPLFELAQAALASGEKINANILKKFPQLQEVIQRRLEMFKK
jgi:hypothetical protein